MNCLSLSISHVMGELSKVGTGIGSSRWMNFSFISGYIMFMYLIWKKPKCPRLNLNLAHLVAKFVINNSLNPQECTRAQSWPDPANQS